MLTRSYPQTGALEHCPEATRAWCPPSSGRSGVAQHWAGPYGSTYAILVYVSADPSVPFGGSLGDGGHA